MTKSQIIARLDTFVATTERANGVYAYEHITKINPNPYSTTYGIGGSFDYPIQQSRQEIYALIELLLDYPRDVILETGCGEWGGTHFLWQSMFNKVITVEVTQSIVDKISYPLTEQDVFIVKDSRLALDDVKKVTDSVDVLLLDSHHVWDVLDAEYRLYAPLVRPGGLILFHDALSPLFPDVGRWLAELQAGHIDNETHELSYIDNSPGEKIGIAYMIA